MLHPGQSASVGLEGETLGWLGALRPGLRAGKDPLVVAEVALDPIVTRSATVARFETLARHPLVERDLSILADAGVAAGEVVRQVQAAAGELLRRVEVKDRYDRPPVPAGKVSLMLSLRYQDPARTLTSDEVQASVEAVIRKLRGAGLEIRDKYGE
jgi:phenylalanyl-tRNA synthetase beta chain